MRIAQAELKELLNEAYPDVEGIEDIADFVSDEVVEEMEMLYGQRRFCLTDSIENMKDMQKQLKGVSFGQSAASRKSVMCSRRTLKAGNQTAFSFEFHGMKLAEDEAGRAHHRQQKHVLKSHRKKLRKRHPQRQWSKDVSTSPVAEEEIYTPSKRTSQTHVASRYFERRRVKSIS